MATNQTSVIFCGSFDDCCSLGHKHGVKLQLDETETHESKESHATEIQ